MDVLSENRPDQLARRMATSGPRSYVGMLMQFHIDWSIDLTQVIARIDTLQTSEHFAWLIRDILMADHKRTNWHLHRDAKSEVTSFLDNAMKAFETVLRPSPDYRILTLEYLSEGLLALKNRLCR